MKKWLLVYKKTVYHRDRDYRELDRRCVFPLGGFRQEGSTHGSEGARAHTGDPRHLLTTVEVQVTGSAWLSYGARTMTTSGRPAGSWAGKGRRLVLGSDGKCLCLVKGITGLSLHLAGPWPGRYPRQTAGSCFYLVVETYSAWHSALNVIDAQYI